MLIPHFSFSQILSENNFELAAFVPEELLVNMQNTYEGRTSIYYEQMCIVNSPNSLLIGIILNKNYKNKVVFIDEKGNISRETNWVNHIPTDLGEPLAFRSLDNEIYLAADGHNAYCVKEDSLVLVDSPFTEVNLRGKYSGVNFQYEVSFLGYVPLFRITNKYICNIDLNGFFSQYTRETMWVRSFTIKFPEKNTTIDKQFSLWLDFIIGFYDEVLFLWARGSELIVYDSTSKKLEQFKIAELFSSYDIGIVKSKAESLGLSYYALSDTFYIFCYTSKGIYLFKYKN